MGEKILKKCRTGTPSWYPDVGHAPFLEEPARFNSELAEFVRAGTTTRGRQAHFQ
jgi:hypothetical protein